MRRSSILALAVLLLASCEREPPPEELAADAERDIAMVEQANNAAPPLREVTPEPIGFDDIEQHDISGVACNYAPGTSLGTRAIAREVDAFVKVEGEVLRLAADTGSRELPSGSHSVYDGRQYSLRLDVAGDGEPAGEGQAAGVTNYEGTMSLRDSWGREVYRGTGLVQCGG